jgi:glyoxylase-like metal-dependent hydrolase (beta-lactamase superfamily II)
MGAAAIAALARGRAQAQGLTASPLRGSLALVSGAGGNIVLQSGADGLLMIDSGAPEHAQDLIKVIAARHGSTPVRVLFNTHWHLDHTGGNEAIIRDGATVIAHENTRLWMSTKFFVDWENKRYLPRPRGAWPTKTFWSHEPQPQELVFNGRKAAYAHLLGAHTDGDIYVAFPDDNVIVAGGALTAREYPILDYSTGGWIGGIVDATKKFIALADSDTLVVPDRGPPQRRADLEAQLTMLETVRERIEVIALEGRGVDDMIAENITKDFDARYGGDSALFIANAYEGMWWNRLRGTVA